MSDTAPIEAALIAVVETLRHDYGATLQQRGVSMERPKISVLRSELASYTSEMRIDIIRLDTRELVDRLELFVFENGKPALTDEELRVWILEQMNLGTP